MLLIIQSPSSICVQLYISKLSSGIENHLAERLIAESFKKCLKFNRKKITLIYKALIAVLEINLWMYNHWGLYVVASSMYNDTACVLKYAIRLRFQRIKHALKGHRCRAKGYILLSFTGIGDVFIWIHVRYFQTGRQKIYNQLTKPFCSFVSNDCHYQLLTVYSRINFQETYFR